MIDYFFSQYGVGALDNGRVCWEGTKGVVLSPRSPYQLIGGLSSKDEPSQSCRAGESEVGKG